MGVVYPGVTLPANRGVLYIKWGIKSDDVLQRSLNSLRAFHPDWPVHVAELPPNSTLLDKANMMEMTPFEETLFLDVDTVVMDRLDYGFERAARFGLACCICENPWGRRHAALSGDIVEYNTGVLFFTRQVKPVFDRWAALAPKLDSAILHRNDQGEIVVQHRDDQAAFAQAIEDLRFCPFVLPLNWNLRPIFHDRLLGPVKIWHGYADPPPGLAEYNKTQWGDQKILGMAQLA